jgi:hypothetical protein
MSSAVQRVGAFHCALIIPGNYGDSIKCAGETSSAILSSHLISGMYCRSKTGTAQEREIYVR